MAPLGPGNLHARCLVRSPIIPTRMKVPTATILHIAEQKSPPLRVSRVRCDIFCFNSLLLTQRLEESFIKAPTSSSPSVNSTCTTQRPPNRMQLSLDAIDIPGANSQQPQEKGANWGSYHERMGVHQDGNPVPDKGASSRKRITSEKLPSRTPNGLSHLDLSGKVTMDTSFRPVQGGYADVYKGYCSMPGKECQVAIKRLRIHAGVNCDVFKVRTSS